MATMKRAKRPTRKQPAKTKATKRVKRPKTPTKQTRSAKSTRIEQRRLEAAQAARKALRKPPKAPAKGSERAELLRAVLENPDDDGARLVYADLLQREGDPRGEYIVLTMTKGAKAADMAGVLSLRYREKEWEAFGAHGAIYQWSRGFIRSVCADREALVKAGPLMFELEPIEELTPIGDPGHLDTILSYPLRIRHLCVDLGDAGDQLAVANATIPTVTSVRIGALGEGGALTLAQSSGMPRLEEFGALDCGIGDRGFAALVNGSVLASVKQLWLAKNKLSATSVAALADAPLASQLTALGLSDNPLGDAGVAALARSERLSALRTLYLGTNTPDKPTLGAGAAEALVAAAKTTFAKLETLDLSRNITGDALARVKAAYGKRLSMCH